MTAPRDFYLRRYKPTLDAKQDKYEPFRAVITANDGSRTTGDIWKDEDARQVWYQAWGSGSIGWALCDAIEPYIGLGVIIQFNPLIGFHEVMRDDPLQRSSASNRSSYRAVTNDDFLQGGRFQLWIDPTMIIPLSIYPGSAGLTVSIVSGDYIYGGDRKTYAGTVDYDISAEQPAGPNEHNLVGLYLDSANALNVVTGAVQAIGVDAPEPAWPAGAFRLGVIDINDTQTTVDMMDITNRKVVWTEDDGTAAGGAWAAPGKVNLWDVSADVVITYTTVVAAAAAAEINDVIIVGAGTYDGAVDLPVPVSLVGIPGQQCIITNNAGAEGYTVRLSAVGALAGGYTISNLRITNGGGNGATDTCILDNASIDITNYQNVIDTVYLFIDPTPAYAGVNSGIRKTINSRLLIYNANIKSYTDTPGGGTGNAIHCTAGDTWIYTSYLDGETNEIYATGAGTDIAVPPGTQLVNGNITAAAGADIFGWSDNFGSIVQLSTSTWLEMFEGAGDGDKVSIFYAVDSATGLTDPGSDIKVATEKAIVAYGNANWGGSASVWPLEGDLTNTNDGVSYATVALLIAALAAGEQGIIGNGTFTSDDVDITENIRLLGSGIDATILQTTTDDKVLDFNTGDCLLEGFTLKNTFNPVNAYALYSLSSSLQLTRIKMVLTGAATNNNGAFLSGGTHKLYDCIFNVSGASGSNAALYVDDNTTVNLFNASIEAGNVSVNYSANPVTVSFFGGTIVGNIAADGSGATVKLYGPKITGTLTATNSATISGWYYDSNNNLKSASTVDIFPQASTNGLNARFERLFGDDVPAGKTAYQNNPFVADTLASNIIGFSAGDTAVDSDSYTPSAPFSKSNTGTQYFYVLDHYLRMNSQASGTCSLTWTSSTGKNDYVAYVQWLTRSVTTYGGEVRFWGVQTPGGADIYWACRFIYDATTYPDWPWRVKIFTGTGVTYAIADGTERAQAPCPVFSTNRLLLRTRPATGQADIQLISMHAVIPDTQVATYLAGGSPFTTFKTATMYLATSYQQIALDSITIT